MGDIKIYNSDKQKVDMDLVFSFVCKENGKTYIAIDNHDEIFEPNSRYNNLDILEVQRVAGKTLIVTDIPEDDWDMVKKALQFTVFAKMGQ